METFPYPLKTVDAYFSYSKYLLIVLVYGRDELSVENLISFSFKLPDSFKSLRNTVPINPHSRLIYNHLPHQTIRLLSPPKNLPSPYLALNDVRRSFFGWVCIDRPFRPPVRARCHVVPEINMSTFEVRVGASP